MSQAKTGPNWALQEQPKMGFLTLGFTEPVLAGEAAHMGQGPVGGAGCRLGGSG